MTANNVRFKIVNLGIVCLTALNSNAFPISGEVCRKSSKTKLRL